MSNMVVCPVCEGDGLNPLGHCAVNPTCKCCSGDGEITEVKRDALEKIKADLTRMLEERHHKRNIGA